jgi:hypothetical protein
MQVYIMINNGKIYMRDRVTSEEKLCSVNKNKLN